MSTSWAIIIGINQYQGFQPLMQAQNDAVGIRRYLIDDAGFAPENCILLSDLSTSIEQQAVYPDRVAINDWLETICQGRVQSGDTLWFYFSGYGAQADNKDYLMPVDGDPAQVKQTGIALQDVVKYLKQSLAENTIMVLDMNRSQSALAGQAIGEQVVKLASKARIPLILSCQPNEFSHETLAVRHGLFTAGLLEGLRYDGCATLSHLERYLVERVPELCEHHWRPMQNPLVALPEEQKFQLLWHQRSTTEPETIPAPAPETMPEPVPEIVAPINEPEPISLIPDNPDAVLGAGAGLISEPVPETAPDVDLLPTAELPPESAQDSLSLYPEELDDKVDDPDEYGTTLVNEEVPDVPPKRGALGGCLGLLGALAALLLLAGVLLRNQPVVQQTLQERVPPEWLARIGLEPDGDEPLPDEPDAEPSVGEGTDNAEGTDESTEAPAAEGPPDLTGIPDETETADGSETEDKQDETLADSGSGVDDPDAGAADAGASDAGASDAGADVDNPDAGTDEADDTTEETDTDTPTPVEAVGTTTPNASDNETDTADILAEARRSLGPSQASQFASAIATARQISPGDPNYAQAQADIKRWSQVILDLAEGRAAETELDAAIEAAELIPSEPADVYQQAQERIKFWQARAETRALIREAQAIPRIGQASTYQKGILKLQEVPANQPTEYADAQRLIGEWTEKMLTIARARAAQGRYNSAIEAASLIPQNTPNYDEAQAEINRWQGD
ncbi:MAG: caspase family protein [Cyanobacteria bacterium P01_F01_bin.13]